MNEDVSGVLQEKVQTIQLLFIDPPFSHRLLPPSPA
jgi:16S rRNA G966 N2-methylase RsmD